VSIPVESDVLLVLVDSVYVWVEKSGTYGKINDAARAVIVLSTTGRELSSKTNGAIAWMKLLNMHSN